jgi:hypothetical protein
MLACLAVVIVNQIRLHRHGLRRIRRTDSRRPASWPTGIAISTGRAHNPPPSTRRSP